MLLIFAAPTFVSMHEIGDYIYFFFLEIALETPNEVKLNITFVLIN